MNLMPFKCKTDEDGKCKYSCDYKYYGNMPECYVPILEKNENYAEGPKLNKDGSPINYFIGIDPNKILEEYIKMKKSG